MESTRSNFSNKKCYNTSGSKIRELQCSWEFHANECSKSLSSHVRKHSAPADTVISEGPYRTKAFQIEGTKGKIIVPQGLFPRGTDVSSIHTIKLPS